MLARVLSQRLIDGVITEAINACTLLGASVALLMTTGTMAQAQDPARNPLPPDSMVTSPGGVDLRSGRMNYDVEDLSIGDPGRGGISFKRVTINPRPTPFGNDSFQTGTMGQFSDNWDIALTQLSRGSGKGYDVSISGSGVSANFYTFSRSTFTRQSADYVEISSTISGGNATYTLMTKDGRTISFPPIGTSNGTVLATKIEQADGVTYTLSYGSNRRRVQSNAGYALLLESSTAGITKACVLNLANVTLPTGDTCPSGVPTASYAYSGPFISSIVAADQSTWNIENTFTANGNPFDMSFFYPGASTPYLINHFVISSYKRVVGSQDYGDGRHYDYNWDEVTWGETDTTPPKYDVIGTGYVLNSTDTTQTIFSSYPSTPPFAPIFSTGPASVTDPLGRTTNFTYCVSCVPVRLDSKRLPLGMTESYTYDGYRNITKIVRSPGRAAAFPSPPPATQVQYGYSCATLVSCSKPTSITDASGAVTTNEYDPVHGGLTKTTAPAVGGVTPQVRYTYAQKSAWIKSGSTYVQATPAIWVLASESTCRTSAPASSGSGCSAANDEVVTTYDYGPNNGPNNLLLRGKVVTADGVDRRTCYGYDGRGNRVSETLPRAGLGVCP